MKETTTTPTTKTTTTATTEEDEFFGDSEDLPTSAEPVDDINVVIPNTGSTPAIGALTLLGIAAAAIICLRRKNNA
jgi:hypothetical protein